MEQPPIPSPPKVDLNWVSLLWIAVIVGVCAGGGHRSHQSEFDALKARIDRLEKKIDALSAQQRRRPASAPSSAAATPAR